MSTLPKCNVCGRFMSTIGSSAYIYDFAAGCLDYEHVRCVPCTDRIGAAQSNARPADGDMSPYQSSYTKEAAQ